jgi:hypothetical protein
MDMIKIMTLCAPATVTCLQVERNHCSESSCLIV